MDDELKKIKKVYLELQALETNLSDYPFKEKNTEKSLPKLRKQSGINRKKEEELRALCRNQSPIY